MDFKIELGNRHSFIEDNLKSAIPNVQGPHGILFDSMKYSLAAGGKRLRPMLLLEACRISGGDIEKAMPFACAIEMIHTYSLIHDDLPAMDDDDLRRGKPTNHKVYGEGIAVLAGDGLLNYAFETMLEASVNSGEDCMRHIRAANEIAKGAGVFGMIAGQTADLESEGKRVDEATLEFIHMNKTAQLIIRPMRAGAILAGASEEALEAITEYAKNIGLGFQIVDDILDVIGDQEKLGKNVGSDIEKEKSTYPSMYGLEESKQIAFDKIAKAKAAISFFGSEAEFLLGLADYITDREF